MARIHIKRVHKRDRRNGNLTVYKQITLMKRNDQGEYVEVKKWYTRMTCRFTKYASGAVLVTVKSATHIERCDSGAVEHDRTNIVKQWITPGTREVLFSSTSVNANVSSAREVSVKK